VFKAPESFGKFGLDQQGVHGPLLQKEVRRTHESTEGAAVGSSAAREIAAALRRTSSEIDCLI
jgi:hypothetical protein